MFSQVQYQLDQAAHLSGLCQRYAVTRVSGTEHSMKTKGNFKYPGWAKWMFAHVPFLLRFYRSSLMVRVRLQSSAQNPSSPKFQHDATYFAFDKRSGPYLTLVRWVRPFPLSFPGPGRPYPAFYKVHRENGSKEASRKGVSDAFIFWWSTSLPHELIPKYGMCPSNSQLIHLIRTSSGMQTYNCRS